MIDFNKPKHLVIGIHYNDPPAPNASESTGDVLSAEINYLPALMQVLREQVLPAAQTDLATSKVISPEQNQLMVDLYKQFAPQLAQVGSEIDAQTRKNTAATDVDILKNQGAQLADVYKSIDKNLNPEYYTAREGAGNALSTILNETTNALSQPDIEAERLISQEAARSGNDVAPSAQTTTANAISFADQRQKRINNLRDAIGSATQFLQPASNAQFNPAVASIGKPTANTGTNQFAGVSGPQGQQAYGTGNNLLNNISSFQNNAMGINANRRDILDRMNETTTAIGSL